MLADGKEQPALLPFCRLTCERVHSSVLSFFCRHFGCSVPCAFHSPSISCETRWVPCIEISLHLPSCSSSVLTQRTHSPITYTKSGNYSVPLTIHTTSLTRCLLFALSALPTIYTLPGHTSSTSSLPISNNPPSLASTVRSSLLGR